MWLLAAGCRPEPAVDKTNPVSGQAGSTTVDVATDTTGTSEQEHPDGTPVLLSEE